jgi:hypothetical protein
MCDSSFIGAFKHINLIDVLQLNASVRLMCLKGASIYVCIFGFMSTTLMKKYQFH